MKITGLYFIIVSSSVFLLSSCQKEISFETNNSAPDSLPTPNPLPATVPPITKINTWQFIDSDNNSLHHGIIDTVKTEFDVRSLWNYLKIVGWPLNSNEVNNDTMFLIGLFLPNPVIEAGVYEWIPVLMAITSLDMVTPQFCLHMEATKIFATILRLQRSPLILL